MKQIVPMCLKEKLRTVSRQRIVFEGKQLNEFPRMAFSLILSGNCIAGAAVPYKLELKDSSFICLTHMMP